MDFQHHTPITVRWGDMDAYGHVNNAIFFRYLETARFDYLEQKIMPLIKGETPVIVLAEINCSFETPIFYPNELSIKTKVNRLGNTSFDIYAEIWTPERRAAKSTAVAVLIDSQTQRPKLIPQDLATAIRHLENL